MTACTSTECPIREDCYRANFSVNEQQDRFNYEYGCNEFFGFRDFVPIQSHHKNNIEEKDDIRGRDN